MRVDGGWGKAGASVNEWTVSGAWVLCDQLGTIPVSHEDYLLSVDPCGCSCGYTHCGILC
ncbi:hypothetical protein INR49_001740 [Caranx melampygus]|nr:hypothetical protein INR49_001740 [Caranx melampygus]